jgi:hypothetical protein
VLSTVQASTPGFGGTVLMDFNAAVYDVFVATSGGSAVINIPVPTAPAYVGFVAYAQCGGTDPTQSQNIAMSNGLAITIGQ